MWCHRSQLYSSIPVGLIGIQVSRGSQGLQGFWGCGPLGLWISGRPEFLDFRVSGTPSKETFYSKFRTFPYKMEQQWIKQGGSNNETTSSEVDMRFLMDIYKTDSLSIAPPCGLGREKRLTFQGRLSTTRAKLSSIKGVDCHKEMNKELQFFSGVDETQGHFFLE